ncbi:MAG: hypothetical protein R2706_18555 [Acidimicrobiales bacterium]
MLRFLARRLGMLALTLLGASFAIYTAMYLAPGNPIAALTGGRTPSPEAVAVLEERYHLNDPFLVRYFRWLGAAVRGDLGVSILFDKMCRRLSGNASAPPFNSCCMPRS